MILIHIFTLIMMTAAGSFLCYIFVTDIIDMFGGGDCKYKRVDILCVVLFFVIRISTAMVWL